MLDVAETHQGKGVTVAELKALQPGDARMVGDEAIPLPRDRIEAEKVTQHHPVGARVSDDQHLQIRLIKVPHRQDLLGAVDAEAGEVGRYAGAHPFDEGARRFTTTLETPPAVFRRTCALLGVCRCCQFCRAAVPVGLTDLVEEGLHLLPTALKAQQGRRRLASPRQRGDDDVVELLGVELLPDMLGLHPAPSGEGWVNDTEAVADPFRFPVADEHDLHSSFDRRGNRAESAGNVEAVSETRSPGGWHPDPTGRFEFRWYNGEQWTADVSIGGRRFVDPGPPAIRPSQGTAVASFVIAMVSLFLAWVPFVFVLAAVGAAVAFGLGIGGVRRAATEGGTGRGFAVAGIAISVAAAGLCVVGGFLTAEVWRDMQELSEAGPHRVSIDSCDHEGRLADATGTITNLDDKTATFIVTVSFTDADGKSLDLTSVAVDDIAPGRTERFTATAFIAADQEVGCEIEDVSGPGFLVTTGD